LVSHQGETKSIFRAAMRGIVPDSVLERKDKIGFATPEEGWLGLLSDQVFQWITTPVGVPFLHQKQLVLEFEAVLSGRIPYSWKVWRWINFLRWLQLLDVAPA
jgi:asparagine synthase (glutamine-hydrolysing)